MDLYWEKKLPIISDQKSEYLYNQLLDLSYQTTDIWYPHPQIEDQVNQICKELKKRRTYINELANRYRECNDEWDRIDDMWLKDDRQSSLTKEMTRVWFVLNKLWFDTNWVPLKSERIATQVAKKVEFQLSLPWFEQTKK